MQFLEKFWKNPRDHRGINLVTTKARRSYLVSELNLLETHNKSFFSDNLLAI